MKKSIFVLLLAMVLLVSACGSSNADNQPAEQGSASAANGIINDGLLTLGTVEGSTYENASLGYGCTLDGWVFADSAAIAEMNNIAANSMDETLLDQLSNADTFMDMYAEQADGMATVNVNVENLSKLEQAIVSEQDYVDLSYPNTEYAMSQAGYSNVQVEKVTVNLAGDEHPGMTITSDLQGIPVFQKQATVMFGEYMASVTVTTYYEDATDNVFALFYKLG